MTSFRLARRSFLAAVGGALGLRVLLDNMVASAAGATSPPRLLLTHWPIGTVRCLFKPTGSGTSYTASPILRPFVDAGLRDDMSVLYGLSHRPFDSAIGGGHESGTVMMTTGQRVPGVRANGGEADDGVAGGPSFDQIFLKNTLDLETPGTGYVNAICDARVDSFETSSRCLSYSHAKRMVAAASGGMVEEATPLLPERSPLQLYLRAFSGFMPGGGSAPNQEALLHALKNRKSVLDFSLRELERLRALAPGSERVKIDAHAEAVRKLEQQLTELPPEQGTCTVPGRPDPSLAAKSGSSPIGATSEPTHTEPDYEHHAQVGALHTDVIVAAFQCDLFRVATFQWAPGSSHVAFKGLYPGRPEQSYMHRQVALLVEDPGAPFADSLPDGVVGERLQFLANVQAWYNTQHALLLKKLKETKDAQGNSLLDYTVVPYLTEVAACTSHREPLPALLFGGKALGMRHGSFLDFEPAPRHHNDLWLTVAQAYWGADPLAKLPTETFDKNGVQTIEGLWQPPA